MRTKGLLKYDDADSTLSALTSSGGSANGVSINSGNKDVVRELRSGIMKLTEKLDQVNGKTPRPVVRRNTNIS